MDKPHIHPINSRTSHQLFSGIHCFGRSDGKCEGRTEGGPGSNITIRMIGHNFGWFNLSWDLFVGPYVVTSKDIISWSDNVIDFYPPAGCGRNLRVKLDIGRQKSTESTKHHFSYSPPIITAAQQCLLS